MRKIKLSQGKYALVDDADFPLLSQFKWCASLESRGTKWYAIRWARKGDPEYVPGRRIKIRMHRWLLGQCVLPGPDDPIVDHDDDNGLNNQRSNLVLRTQAENMAKVENWNRKKGQDVWV